MSYRKRSNPQYMTVTRKPRLGSWPIYGSKEKKYADQWNVGSHSDPSKFYTVSLTVDGDYECSCPQWIYRRRECKHIQEVKDNVRAQTFASQTRVEDFFIDEHGDTQLKLPI
ncbi:MAG: hypothetical protein QXF26_08000 [Candidatus Bathyarchaeia archaeon]